MNSEPTISFHGAALKWAWAEALYDRLAPLVREWESGGPVELNQVNRRGTSTLRSELAEPIPSDFSLLTGDICSNLRASYDCCWMGLLRQRGVREKKTMPLADNRKGIRSTLAKSPLADRIDDLERLLCDQIGTHKDHSDGGSDVFHALNDLTNWNKHNNILLASVRTEYRDFVMPGIRVENMIIEGGGSIFETDYVGDFNMTVGSARASLIFGRNLLDLGQDDFAEGQEVLKLLQDFLSSTLAALKAFLAFSPSENNPILP